MENGIVVGGQVRIKTWEDLLLLGSFEPNSFWAAPVGKRGSIKVIKEDPPLWFLEVNNDICGEIKNVTEIRQDPDLGFIFFVQGNEQTLIPSMIAEIVNDGIDTLFLEEEDFDMFFNL